MENRVGENRTTNGSPAVVQRYVDILTDAGFKAVFGDQRNKDVLVDMLNALLPLERKISDITYQTTEMPAFSLFNKSTRLDLRCCDEDGRQFIVEVQCYHQANFFRRCVLYASKAYDVGSQRGDGQKYNIPPVYFLGLLDKDMQDLQRYSPEGSVVSEYTFREKTTMQIPDETIFCIFVELNRFGKTLEECENMLDKWCFSLTYISTLDRLPDELKTEAFERLFQACEIARFEPEVKLTYEKEMFTERDYYNIIDTAREDGIAIGEAKGRVEGLVEVARKMLEADMDTQTIMAMTGLTDAQIAEL